MNTALLRLTRRSISRRALQSALFVLGIALGVAVGVAIDLANTSARQAFTLSVNTITGRTTHQIVGASGQLPYALYAQIRADFPQITSAPVIQTAVQAPDLDNRTLRVLGIDPVAEAPFRDYLALTATSNSGLGPSELRAFVTEPRAVILSASLAERYDLVPGDTFSVRTRSQTNVALTVIGTLTLSRDVDESALSNVLIMPLATAQAITGQPDAITRIDLILPNNFDLSLLREALPPGATITTPATTQNALSQMTDAFEFNLQALSLLALMVGVFLIYNTVTFSVVQRRPVIGILRSLGTTRRQIFTLILGEAFILGTLGTLLGLGLGIILGQGAVKLVAQTINDLYFRVSVDRVIISAPTLIKGALTGIAASLLAALLPAWEATRTAPAGVMRRSSVEQGTRQAIPWLTSIAILLILAGILVLQIPTNNVIVSFLALFMVLIGCALLTPLALIILMYSATPLTQRLFGVLGRMAPRAIMRALSRTSVAVTALTLAVSVIVGVSVMINSFRTTVINWMDVTLGADIYISPFDDDADGIAADIDPALLDTFAALDGIDSVAAVRSTEVIAPDYPDLPPVYLIAPTVDITHGERRFAWLDIPADTGWWEALAGGDVVVSEPFAFRRDITRENNTITLLTDQGPQPFRVVGVYYDYTSDQGALMMHHDVYQQFYADPYLSAIALNLAPDADLSATLDTLRSRTLVNTSLEAQSNRALRENVITIFDRTFSITIALRLLATIVAFIGILSALLSLQLEHTRQYGIMRANGMTPGQLRIFTFVQTGLMGTTAGILAAPIGLVLALILIEVINVRSFGWSMTLTLGPQEFTQAFLVALIAALVAGIYPAWRLGKLVTAAALRSE